MIAIRKSCSINSIIYGKKMKISKRIFDLTVSCILGLIFIPFILLISILILICEGRPVFYISERMLTVEKSFRLIKFRTMRTAIADTGVSGGDKTDRITKTGHFLRRTRLDEIPQIWNVFCGDMSFVGPRPPLPQYTKKFPRLYRKVLRSRPGVTGLGSLRFHAHEERILARSCSTLQTEDLYTRICIPRKARLDLIYQKHSNFCFDIWIMMRTVTALWK